MFSVVPQAASLMDFKTYLAVEALMTTVGRRENESTDAKSINFTFHFYRANSTACFRVFKNDSKIGIPISSAATMLT